MSNRHAFLLLSPLLVVLVAGFLLPVVFMFPTSLQSYSAFGQTEPPVFTLENYIRFFTDSFYREIIGRTLVMGAIVTLVCLLMGYPLAYYIVRGGQRWRIILTLLVIFPLLLNIVVRTFGWVALLANHGLINTLLMDVGLIDTPIKFMFNLSGVTVGLVHVHLPFMVLMLVAAIQNVPRDLELAAANLGSSPATVFRKVMLPLSVPGIFSGSLLVFVLSISALVTPRMLGGPTYKVMATLIYDEYMLLLDWPSGAALSFALTFIMLAIVWGANFLSSRSKGFA